MDKMHELILDPDNPGNRDWYAIYDGSADLIERIDKVHRSLEKTRVPRIFPRKFRIQMHQLYKEFDKIVPDFNAWWQNARMFTERPSMFVTTRDEFPEDRVVGYLHYLLVITNRISALEMKMNNTIRDLQQYRLFQRGIESQFRAMIYFAVGVSLSIFSLILAVMRTVRT